MNYAELKPLNEQTWSCPSTSKKATVIFDGTGRVLCKPPKIAETATLTVIVIAPSRFFPSDDLDRAAAETAPGAPARNFSEPPFVIEITPGEAIGSRIHGDYSKIKQTLGELKKSDINKCEDQIIPQRYRCLHKSHPAISAKDVTIKLTSKEVNIDKSITISVAQRFSLGIGALAAVTNKDKITYGITDKVVTESADRNPVTFYITLEVPLFFPSEQRFYDYAFTTWKDRFSLLAGLGVPDPRESLALGVSVRIFNGISLAAVWMPQKRERLSEGAVGDMVEGEEISTNKVWSFKRFGIGVALDSNLVGRLAGALK